MDFFRMDLLYICVSGPQLNINIKRYLIGGWYGIEYEISYASKPPVMNHCISMHNSTIKFQRQVC